MRELAVFEYSGSINAESSLSTFSFELHLLFMFEDEDNINVALSFLLGEGEILHTRVHGKVKDKDILRSNFKHNMENVNFVFLFLFENCNLV